MLNSFEEDSGPGQNIYKSLYRTTQNAGRTGTNSSERVLIVDDEPGVRYMTSKILKMHQYNVVTASSAEEALGIASKQSFDLVISDISMPGMNGLEFLEALQKLDPLTTPIIMTGSGSAMIAVRAMKSGAQGFIPKPFTEGELITTIESALRDAKLVRENMAMKLYMPLLEKTNAALLNALEAKDSDSQGHSQRVADAAVKLATQLGMSEEKRTQCYFGALFHDIGKIGVSDDILRKSGPLNSEESKEMARHPEIGAHIISMAKGMDEASNIILHHHERFDGLGYPSGLRGEDIPLGARIVAIIDAYEEMTSRTVYAENTPQSEAISELIKGKGLQYDPDLVDRFIDIINSTSLSEDQ